MTCISLKTILLECQDMINDGLNIRATTIREPQSWDTCVMSRSGVVLELRYKSRAAADKTTAAINSMDKAV